MKTRTKIILAIAIILLIYGYLCRAFDLYFFWDSKELGWNLVFVFGICFLLDHMETRKNQNKNTIGHKIGIGLLTFRVVYGIFFSLYIRFFSDAYDAAINHIQDDAKLQEELGTIQRFSLLPTGILQTQTDSQGESGLAVFHLTAEGEKKFRDLEVVLIKDAENPTWTMH